MAEIVVGEGPGIQVLERIRHQGFFFAHHDADLEQCWLPEMDAFDPAGINWPEGAIILRVMHHVTRLRRIWEEEFVVDEDAVKSKRVFAVPQAELVTDRGALGSRKGHLGDVDGAERLLRAGNCAGIIIDPSRRAWAKLRLGEHLDSP